MQTARFRIRAVLTACALVLPFSALAQAPAEISSETVTATTLQAPDLFSAGGRDTGLGPDLWLDASASTARTVIPLLAERPLSPAASALARAVLATGARGPQGAGDDPDAAAARLRTLIALGEVSAARSILGRTAGVERHEGLSRAAADAALLADDDAGACQVAQGLSVDRDQIYWLRLRAYCQALAGAPAAQLTLDLAQNVERDAVFGRLLGARLAGSGDPGAPSLRNSLDYALSRNLSLDLSEVEPAAPIAGALSGEAPQPMARWPVIATEGPVAAAIAVLAQGDLALAENVRATLIQDEIPQAEVLDLALLDALIAAASGRHDRPTLDRLVERGGVGEARDRRRAQDAALILSALGTPLDPEARGEFAAFSVAAPKAPPARIFVMEQAARAGLKGETALLALWTSAEAGLGGPAPADRARIIAALSAAGLADHAQAYAVEGLLALR
ncbi:hypothetical protein [Phenylobacterium sp.]|uniref:hypothetical protein n=1 Tax=Phenylobacterium sp. TaxID=1871053 RepID=UPI00272FD2ED|nr:hypothetical protein [Phenylobacterium sp.]MDP1617431.1 hypothetical protein [Phenylobacterium sp.]MDP1987468.1 hypothetical protein [Phenylobacterium sp.]